MRSDKGAGRPRAKFRTPYRLSGICKDCTPDKRGKRHSDCANLNCICPHHPNWTALHAREAGLRTQAKPGDFDYAVKANG
jgi:hypothetical protein